MMSYQFANFFHRQRDEYSCGPACMATVFSLAAGGIKTDQISSYAHFRKLMRPDPDYGTPQETMESIAQGHLPYAQSGPNGTVLGGKVSIGLVRYWYMVAGTPESEGHYVVILDIKGHNRAQTVTYYDPYDHRINQAPFEDFDWRAEQTLKGEKQYGIGFDVSAKDVLRHLRGERAKPFVGRLVLNI